METITTRNLPSNCWIYANREYWYHSNDSKNQLPIVNAKYEPILQAYGIPYRKFKGSYGKDTEFCEYHNPKNYSTEELTLPLFAKISDENYYYCQKNYTGIVFSEECINAALETKVLVRKAIKDYHAILDNVSLYWLVKKELAGNVTKMAYIEACNFKYISNIDISCRKCSFSPDYIYDIEMNHDSFLLIRLINFNWVAIFDMNKLANNYYLSLEVPNHIAPLVIGRNGANIKLWEKEIGVETIHVTRI